jgi:hypothetical protein
MLPLTMMGEGLPRGENPSPIRNRGRTIVPSPARGEGTGGNTAWRTFWEPLAIVNCPGFWGDFFTGSFAGMIGVSILVRGHGYPDRRFS